MAHTIIKGPSTTTASVYAQNTGAISGYIISAQGSGGGAIGSGQGYVSPNSHNTLHPNLNNQVKIHGKDADLIIGEKSMVKWMQKVEERLLILAPKPELLAKYENLREAYEHYKTLEALLHEEKK